MPRIRGGKFAATSKGIAYPPSAGGLWLPDWSAYTSVINWTKGVTVVNAQTWGTVLDISGEGYLTFVRGNTRSSGISSPDVRVTVDGTVCVFTGSKEDPGTTYISGNMITMPIYFGQTLKIEIYNHHAVTNYNMGCDYTYLTKSTTPQVSKQTVLDASSRTMVNGNTTSLTLVNLVNISGAGWLWLIDSSGRYVSANGFVYLDLILDGVTKINNQFIMDLTSLAYKQHKLLGPVRFDTSLQIRHRVDNAGSTAITRAWYTLD